MQNQLPWWISGLVIPAFFTVFGTILGFLVGELKDRWQASRGRRAFLEAIVVELRGIKTEFELAAKSAEMFVDKLQESGHAPQLIPKWGTAVFDTQLGKLRNVADGLIFRTIKTYAAIARVDRTVAFVNDNSREYVTAKAGNEKAMAQPRLRSALLSVRDEINGALPEIEALLHELPAPKNL